MSYQILPLDAAERAREKQASRDRDAERLQRGEISRAQLARENGLFEVLDQAGFEIVAVGARPPAR
jgi:hypothetical protein